MFRCFYKNSKQRGFTLVELMVVVAIIGILSALAVPRFKVFQAKARQAEAKTNLSHIYTLEQSYFGDNDVYINIAETGLGTTCEENDIGFQLQPCNGSRYKYVVSVSGGGAYFLAEAESGTGGANKVMSGCAAADHWSIDNDRCLCAMNDVTKHCESSSSECDNKCPERSGE